MANDYLVTVDGLVGNPSAASVLPQVNWAIAAGTGDAITAAYTPSNATTGLTDGLILGFRALAANTINNPTFSPDGLTAHPIVQTGGNVLSPGQIPGQYAEVLVRYNLANTRWELLNPRSLTDASRYFAIATGTGDAIVIAPSPAYLTMTDGRRIGFRATATNTLTNPTLTVNALTARTIVRPDGSALQVGDIVSGTDYLLEYDLANTRWKLLNPTYATNAITALTAAMVTGTVFKALAADDTGGQNVATAQPWFPTAGAVTLAVGTYLIEGTLFTTRTAGVTSHTTAIQFGGTATLGVVDYDILASTGDANSLVAENEIYGTSAAAVVAKAASTSATENSIFQIKGILTVTVAGTLIPQFIYSAAPGGAPTVKAGTFFRAILLSNPTGTWA